MDIQDGTFTNTKEYFAKIYAANGDFLSTSYDIGFQSFKKSINGGLGELTLNLARKFDDFGEGEDIDFMNEVQLWVVDKESGATGQKIYSGFIDQYEPYATGTREGVTVRCLGYATRLANVMYKNGTSVSMSHTSTDPKTIAEAVIIRFQAESGETNINYTATSTEATGNTVSYIFNMKSCTEVLDICRELAPAGWWWYVDETNTLYFKPQASVPTHSFTFGRDIADIRVIKNIRDVCNQLVIWNGLMPEDSELLCRSHNDPTSINAYGLRMEQHTDGRILTSGTMDYYGDAYISARKDPNIRVSLTILDSNLNNLGYDIESISPGDTCQILNLPTTSTTFDTNMTITDVTYELNRVTITLEDLRQKMTSKFSDVIKELKTHVYTDGPATYTAV